MMKVTLISALGLSLAQTASRAVAETTMAAVRNEPVTVFMTVIRWAKDASRAEVAALSRVDNGNGFPITDVEVECIHMTVQGVALGQISKKISNHLVGPRAAMYINGINTGFLLETGQRINCRVAQFAKYVASSPPVAKNTIPTVTSPLIQNSEQEGNGASPNAHSRRFLAMSATAQLTFWTSYLLKGGVNCDKAVRTMFQGGFDGIDHWNIACSNGNAFFAEINNEGTGSILNCQSMNCWIKY